VYGVATPNSQASWSPRQSCDCGDDLETLGEHCIRARSINAHCADVTRYERFLSHFLESLG